MKRIATIAAALLLLAASGADAQQLQTVHVSAAPLDTIGNVYYAQELGYLKDAGITVEFIPGQIAAAGVAALAGGSADVAGGAVSSLARHARSATSSTAWRRASSPSPTRRATRG